MNFNKFLSELKRRDVYKVAIAYSITAWLLVQMADLVASSFEAPLWVMKMIIVAVIMGFPIALFLAWIFEMSPSGIIQTGSSKAEDNPFPKNKKKPFTNKLLIGILLFALVGQYAYNKFLTKENIDNAIVDKTIAVLPFRNNSPNEENLYFCNGIMEGILDHLSKIPELTVISRTSVEQYRNNPPSIAEIGSELNVNYIVEGSVMRIEDRVQITAQLIYTPEKKILWSNQFDKNIKNVESIFKILSDVAQDIAEKLRAKISPDLLERIESIPTYDLSAFDYYLQGNEFYNSWNFTRHESDLKNADRLFKTALNIDDKFALAYVGRANIYRANNFDNSFLEKTFLDSVRIYCDKAIILNPGLAEAYLSRGEYYKSRNNIKKAEYDLKMAIELKPNYDRAIGRLSTLYYENIGDYITPIRLLNKGMKIIKMPYSRSQGYMHYGNIYMSIGDWEKSLFYFNKEQELNPQANNIYWNYVVQGKFQAAMGFIENIPQKDTGSQSHLSQLGFIYLMLGEYNQAVEYYEKWRENIDEKNLSRYGDITHWIRYGEALVGTGKTEEGIAIMKDQLQKNEKIIELGRGNYSALYDNAGIYSFLGESQKAIESLRKYNETSNWKSGNVYFIQVDPLFDNIRERSEYQEIVNNRLVANMSIIEEINRMEEKFPQ